MLKKRLIGVVAVRHGLAVQSFGYQRYLPLGDPVCLIQNLDRWGIDEILVIDITRSRGSLGPNLELIERISSSCIHTPLTFGGGISSDNDAVEVINRGADRILVETLLYESPQMLDAIAERIGAQAIVGSISLKIDMSGNLRLVDYISGKHREYNSRFYQFVRDEYISEMVIVDMVNEGGTSQLTLEMLEDLPISIPLIPFGGLTNASNLSELLDYDRTSAIAIGNPLSYKEHALQDLRKKLKGRNIRHAFYAQ